MENNTFGMHSLLLPLDVKIFTIIKKNTKDVGTSEIRLSTFYKIHHMFSLYLINKSTVDHNEYLVSKRYYISHSYLLSREIYDLSCLIYVYISNFFSFSLYRIENPICLYYKDWSQQDIVTNISKSSYALSGGLSDFNQSQKVLENRSKIPWYKMLCKSIQYESHCSMWTAGWTVMWRLMVASKQIFCEHIYTWLIFRVRSLCSTKKCAILLLFAFASSFQRKFFGEIQKWKWASVL